MPHGPKTDRPSTKQLLRLLRHNKKPGQYLDDNMHHDYLAFSADSMEDFLQSHKSDKSFIFRAVSADRAKQVILSKGMKNLILKEPKFNESESWLWINYGNDQKVFAGFDRENSLIAIAFFEFDIQAEEIVETQFRIEFAWRRDRINKDINHDQTILSNIAVVGGIDCDFKLQSADSIKLSETLKYLARTGFIISPEFTLDVINLADGRDFLQEEKKYDLVILLYIYKIGGAVSNSDTKSSDYEGSSFINSPHHSLENWSKCIESTNTKALVSFGGIRSEITVNVVEKSDSFTVAISGKDVSHQDYESSKGDAPYFSAFAFNKDFLSKVQSHFSNNPVSNTTTLRETILADSNLELTHMTSNQIIPQRKS